MAIAPKKGAAGWNTPSAADVAWQPILESLNAYDGGTVVRMLRAAFDNSPAVGFVCRKRADAWLEGWFRVRGFGADLQFPDEDFSRDAMTAFLYRVCPDSAILASGDWTRILTELRLLPAADPSSSMVASGAVRRAVGRVVPGNLYETEGGSK